MMSDYWLLDVIVKSTLLLVGMLGLERLLSSASAAMRHRLLSLGFGMLFVLPAASALAPSWHVPLVPYTWSDPVNQVALANSQMPPTIMAIRAQEPPMDFTSVGDRLTRDTEGKIVAENQTQTAIESGQFRAIGKSSVDDRRAEASADQTVVPTVNHSQRWNVFPLTWLGIWCAGMIAAMFPLGIGVCRIRGICRRGTTIANGVSYDAALEANTLLNMEKKVTLLESHEVSVPLVWGIFWPTLILPKDHSTWSAESRRLVMLHELSHVQRQDILCQLFARIICALYWFHPLAWFALRQLRTVRELACDDCVLAFCDQPSQYAEELLRFAKCNRSIHCLPAVAMAQGRLERRISALLDRARSHSPLNPKLERSLLLTGLVLTAVLSCVRLGAFGVTATVMAGQAPVQNGGAQNAQVQDAAQDNKLEKDSSNIVGYVVTSDNRPILGATVVLRTTTYWQNRQVYPHKSNSVIISRATTDSDGRYVLEAPAHVGTFDNGPKVRYEVASIAASAPGYCPKESNFHRPSVNYSIALTRATESITGRIIDDQGHPIPGVDVRVAQIAEVEPPASVWIEEAQKNPAEVRHENVTSYFRIHTRFEIGIEGLAAVLAEETKERVPLAAKTDADGRFRLKGFGPDYLVKMHIESPLIRTVGLQAITREMEPANAPKSDVPFVTGKVFGNDFTYIAEPAQTVRGTVRDKVSGEPIVGALVHHCPNSYDDGFISYTTDREGRYELRGIPKSSYGIRLSVYPPAGEPYFRSVHLTPSQEGLSVVNYDISLTRCVMVEGVVTDVDTGQPVPSTVQYLPYNDNRHAQTHETFVRSQQWLEFSTDDQGRYRAPILPGKGVLRIRAHDERSYLYDPPTNNLPEHMRTMREKILNLQDAGSDLIELDISEGQTKTARDIRLARRKSFEVHVVDMDGKDVVGYQVAGLSSTSYRPGITRRENYWSDAVVQSPNFRVFDLDIVKERKPLIVFHANLGLGAIIEFQTLKDSTDKPRTVILKPCGKIIGRITGPNGQPAPFGHLVASIDKPTENYFERTHVSHGASLRLDGRFTFLVPPGTEYWLDYQHSYGKVSNSRPKETTVFSGLPIGPGELIDVGDVDITAAPESWPKPVRSRQAPRQVVFGHITHPSGEMLSKLQVVGDFNRSFWELRNDGRFQVGDYCVDEPRDLFFYHPRTDLVGHLRLEGDVPGTPTVKLGKSTTLTGRIVDENGAPVSGLSVRGDGIPYDHHQSPYTGLDGRFTLRGFVPGREYMLYGHLNRRNIFKKAPLVSARILDSTPQDLGDIRWKPTEY